ncbi:MAG: AIR carboxylase family protein [Euryarchaeota archaeon]|nr:AIR carboxylase family protein [Euryarchaeota archaeon]
MPPKPQVAILLGSKSDMPIAEKAARVLGEAGVPYDLQVLSAHREPARLDAYLKSSPARVFICIAGLSAALPGAVAARVKAPVIGVPVSAKLGGLDALLSTVQMPPGVPVACVGVDSGENAARLTLRILALSGA